MIPIINTDNKVEFEMNFGRKFIYAPSSKIQNISLYDANCDDANEVKLFIKDIFYSYYRANIEVKFPFLMAVLDKNSNILAALGFRFADKEALFLEQYVEQPIQNLVSLQFKKKIGRQKIAEIGSLASRGSGISKFLFIAICGYLTKINYSYCAMTGTKKLRKNFKKLSLRTKAICDADLKKLNDCQNNWGSYYKNSPQVMAGDIKTSYQILKTILNITITPSLTKLYPYEQDF